MNNRIPGRHYRLPVTGYRVLDLAGPMGADVIKVEPPGGDPMRDIGPFIDG